MFFYDCYCTVQLPRCIETISFFQNNMAFLSDNLAILIVASCFIQQELFVEFIFSLVDMNLPKTCMFLLNFVYSNFELNKLSTFVPN